MAGTFLDMQTRLMSELKRSNAQSDVKNAINDAISEAAKNRFYLNEISVSFPTVVGVFAYDDMGVVGFDGAWFGPDVDNLTPMLLIDSNTESDLTSFTRPYGAQPVYIAHRGTAFYISPSPTVVTTIYVTGYGKLIPYPLANDADTNSWLTEGERYIRALAKRNYLRDVVRDYGEARVYDAIAEEYKDDLLETTSIKSATGNIRPTQF